jgi:hypothetical protein
MTYANDSLTILNRPADSVQTALDELEPGTLEYEEAVYGLDDAGEVNLYQLQEGDGFFASLVSQPVQLVKATARADFDFYFRNAQSLVPLWLLPIFGLGLFSAVWTRREALKYGFFLVMLLPALVMPVTWSNGTFVMSFAVILMVVTAKGWIYLEGWSSETADELAGWQKADEGHKKLVTRALAVLVLVPVAALSLWTVGRADYPTEYRDAGEWLKASGDDGARVMSREAGTAWYAEGTMVLLPYASVEEVLDYGRGHDADYLVVSRDLVDDSRPQLASLLDSEEAPPGLEVVYSSGEGTGEELIVYRLQ